MSDSNTNRTNGAGKTPGRQGRKRQALTARQAVQFEQAVEFHRTDRLDEAAAVYQEILKVNPRHADAQMSLGTVRLQRGESGEAIQLFDSSIRINPNQPDAFYNRGVALQGLNCLAEALASYDQAIALQPNYPEAHNNRGLTLHGLKRMDEALQSCDRAIALESDNAAAHNNRGLALQGLMRFDEAMQSYDRTIALDPRHTEAHHNRGVLLKRLKQNQAALEAFRLAVETDPGNASARHFIAALSGATPKAAPTDYVVQLFDDYAETFDSHLQEVLRYQTPKRIRDSFDRLFPAGKRVRLVVDLGCGTGLSGDVFRDVASHLVGIDLSGKMLAQARAKNIYSELIEGDLVTCISALPSPVDLFLAADVFVYVGALMDVFAGIAKKSAPGGLFCFSIETTDAGDYSLLETGRFAHSQCYIDRLSKTFGFTILSAEQTELRTDSHASIMGSVYVIQTGS